MRNPSGAVEGRAPQDKGGLEATYEESKLEVGHDVGDGLGSLEATYEESKQQPVQGF